MTPADEFRPASDPTSDDAQDALFTALAHAHRRQVLDLLKARPGMTVGTLAARFEGTISRIAVMKHLRVLEQADLVISRREGRRRLLYFNAVPIQLIYDRWSSEFASLFLQHATSIKAAVEAKHGRRGRSAPDPTPADAQATAWPSRSSKESRS
jgi:DNA-binding transcriptional ArsR family regulator